MKIKAGVLACALGAGAICALGGCAEGAGLAGAVGEVGAPAAQPAHHKDAPPPGLDTPAIGRITGLNGTIIEDEGVFKVTLARTDVKVIVDGRPLEPFMGLTSWAAFTRAKGAPYMLMGDLVLMQDEVNPVMSAALGSGLTVTALHNHFLFDEPRVFFLHIGGEGDAPALAEGVRAAFDAIKQVRGAHAEPARVFEGGPAPAASSIPAEEIAAILGVKGMSKDGMYKAVFGRTVKMPCGCDVGKEMGVNTWAALAGTPEKAVIDGDFVTLEGELQPVLKTLRGAGINITAIHNHMEGETPHAIFLHYWGKGKAADLARAVKAALDAQGTSGTHAQRG